MTMSMDCDPRRLRSPVRDCGLTGQLQCTCNADGRHGLTRHPAPPPRGCDCASSRAAPVRQAQPIEHTSQRKQHYGKRETHARVTLRCHASHQARDPVAPPWYVHPLRNYAECKNSSHRVSDDPGDGRIHSRMGVFDCVFACERTRRIVATLYHSMAVVCPSMRQRCRRSRRGYARRMWRASLALGRHRHTDTQSRGGAASALGRCVCLITRLGVHHTLRRMGVEMATARL